MSKLVPKLRFKEFSGEWEEKRLGDCLDYLQPTKYLVKDTAYNDNYKTPVLTAGKTFILGYTDENDGIFNKDLPVIIFDDFTTATKYVNFPFKAKSSAMKILLAKDNINIKFIYELMQTIRYQVGNHERHWISKFAVLKVFTPTPKEQQKIANTLSSLDNLIEATNKKVEALKEHKKGLMQQLFPADNEKVPKLRFKEFSGEWEEKRLGEISTKQSLKNKDKKISLVLTNSATQGVISQRDYFEKDIANPKNLSNYYLVNKDDFVYNPRVSKDAPVGPIKRNHIGLGVMSPLYTIFSFSEGNTTFFEYFFQTNNWHYYIKRISNHGARHDRMNIKDMDFFKIPLVIPKSPKEQQKIANTLSSLDNLIEATNKKIEALKEHKKGLMQQMFVSGED